MNILKRLFGYNQPGQAGFNINGETITIEGDHDNISVRNGVLYVDGKPYNKEGTKYEVVKIVVNGNVGSVDGTNIEISGSVSRNVDGTNITIGGDVGGSVDGTNITVRGSVNGDIDATMVRRG